MRRRFFTLVCFVCFVVPLSRAADLSFVRIWPAWRDADAFDRISEYFTGKEPTGRGAILRTHPDARAGFYFLVRLSNPGPALADAKFSLQLIAPTSPDTRTYTFPAAVAGSTALFQLGLTGADWPDKKAHPVAWRLDLLAADGRVLATAKSFLWEK